MTVCAASHTSHPRFDYDLVMTHEEFISAKTEATMDEIMVGDDFPEEWWTPQRVFDLTSEFMDGHEARKEVTKRVMLRLVERL